jgi:hypothetical protein
MVRAQWTLGSCVHKRRDCRVHVPVDTQVEQPVDARNGERARELRRE